MAAIQAEAAAGEAPAADGRWEQAHLGRISEEKALFRIDLSIIA